MWRDTISDVAQAGDILIHWNASIVTPHDNCTRSTKSSYGKLHMLQLTLCMWATTGIYYAPAIPSHAVPLSCVATHNVAKRQDWRASWNELFPLSLKLEGIIYFFETF
jgi:hypothetical protein